MCEFAGVVCCKILGVGIHQVRVVCCKNHILSLIIDHTCHYPNNGLKLWMERCKTTSKTYYSDYCCFVTFFCTNPPWACMNIRFLSDSIIMYQNHHVHIYPPLSETMEFLGWNNIGVAWFSLKTSACCVSFQNLSFHLNQC